jgi:hypothetical protein
MGAMKTRLILCGVLIAFFLSADSLAQSRPIQHIEWGRIRGAFLAYCASASNDNAQRIMSLMPVKFDNTAMDREQYEQWILTVALIERQAFGVLDKLLQDGDRHAMRIGLRTLVISDGAFAEQLVGLISKSVIPNPIGFLEESKACLKETGEEKYVTDTVSPPFYDGDDIEKYKTDILFRIRVLETVTRPDLAEVRDLCLRALREDLRSWPFVKK